MFFIAFCDEVAKADKLTMTISPKWRKRLVLLTQLLIILTIIAIIVTLGQWWLAERSFEPLNVLAFAVLSLLSLLSGWLTRQGNADLAEAREEVVGEATELGHLRRQIVNHFNQEELRTLCFDLTIRYDNLHGTTIEAKTVSLMEYVQRHGQLLQLIAILERERPHVVWSSQRYLHNRQNLLQNVQSTWIEGFLKSSLHNAVVLELNLTYQPEAITRKFIHLPGQAAQLVEQPIREVFEAYGRSLLVLGEPGSGKTITLLQLAEALLIEARHDLGRPIPVVLNLASWADKEQPLEAWLIDELFVQYQVAKTLSQNWIRNSQLLYLLDGLDEVAEDARDNCISAINDFKSQVVSDMVVCSRLADYEALQNRLNLGAAVRIEPLADEQIDAYLGRDDLQLQAVKGALVTDSALYSLARTPLFLSIMTLAYRGVSANDLDNFYSLDARRNHLFHTYIERMFERRSLDSDAGYTQSEALHWLTNLAYSLQQHGQSIFYIERLQPTWLPSLNTHRRYVGLVGIIGGLIGAFIFGISVWQSAGSIAGLSVGLIGGLSVGVIGGWSASQEPIALIEELSWAPQPIRQLIPKFIKNGLSFSIFGVFLALSLSVVFWMASGTNISWATGLGIVLSVGSIGGLFRVLIDCIKKREMQKRPRPNQGIRNSRRNALRMGLFFGLGFGLSIGLVAGLILSAIFGSITGLVVGLVVGLSGGLSGGMMQYGGETVVRHYSLRWLLARQEIIPFPLRDQGLVTYLDDMAAHILLRRVGGGWVFIHRTLLEYFAALHSNTSLAQS
ncbi:MAG: NACHT domain-containing protein [Ardenticatenaceae bacterium]|nr:NACHT domain-containing protein [Ardenticatenaceae bacterium]